MLLRNIRSIFLPVVFFSCGLIAMQEREQAAPDITVLKKLLAREDYAQVSGILTDNSNRDMLNELLHSVVEKAATKDSDLQKKRIAFMQFLLDKGANINAKSANGSTALHSAIFTGSNEQVALLLERGANVKIFDRSGKTPFGLALWTFRVYYPAMRTVDLDTIEQLLKAGNGSSYFFKEGCVEASSISSALQLAEIKTLVKKYPQSGYVSSNNNLK